MSQTEHLTIEEIKEAAKAGALEIMGDVRRELDDLRTSHTVQSRKLALRGAEMPYDDGTKTEKREFQVNSLGNLSRSIAAKKSDLAGAQTMLRTMYRDEATAKLLVASAEGGLTLSPETIIARSISEGTPTSAGNLVNTAYYADMIELLYEQSVIRQAGPTIIPMPTGNMTIHRMTGGVSGFYEAELANIRQQQISTDLINLLAKKLALIVPISNELVHDTSGRVNAMVVSDMQRGMALRMDLAALRGDGTANTPKGILNLVDPGQIVDMTGQTSKTAVLKSLYANYFSQKLANARPAIFMSRMAYVEFLYQQTVQNIWMFRDELLQNKLLGMPIFVTSQIPDNLTFGGKSNVTEIYMGDMSEFLIGETDSLSLDYSTEGSYFDGTNLINAFSTDQTLIRARARHDFNLRHNKAFVVAKVQMSAVVNP